jgi:hypothetical protein
MSDAASRVDRLLDAIELVKEDRRAEARVLLRELIQEDSNHEEAWLWLSVAVDTLDQSSVCLDNVLRVNPANIAAAGALYRLQLPELAVQKRRNRLRLIRDFARTAMWFIVMFFLYYMLIVYLG